ncbi:MAG: LacI family DNA-binding transcriptional regulator [Lentisphaeria bacterium]|nr:LacI family DNA-binding transcriptional regulator [Lentisphaeria bacterium]
MVRLVDIANELQLDVSVVSRALNPKPDKHAVIKAETRELIRSTAAKMGYRPNRQAAFLKKGGDATLLCYLPGSADRLVADLMFGISEAAAREGFPLTIFNGNNTADFSSFLQQAMTTGHSGLITYPPGKMDKTARNAFEKYLQQGGKVLMLNAVSNSFNTPAITGHPNLVRLDVDDAYGARLAAEHLHKQGCKVVRCHKHYLQLRANSFAAKARELNMPCSELDYAELPELLKKNTPVGIFATRDADGFNILNKLTAMNIKIGSEVHLVSFDDHNQCVLSIPSLSSVHQPTREEGRRAVEKLINMIFGKIEKDEAIKPYLMVRESSGGNRPEPGIRESETIIY